MKGGPSPIPGNAEMKELEEEDESSSILGTGKEEVLTMGEGSTDCNA